MKRIIAAVLVASMAAQAAGCTTHYPVQPMAAASAPVRAGGDAAAARNPNQVVAAPVSVRPPDVPTGDFLGSPAAGILAGVVLVGAIGLLILAKGSSISSKKDRDSPVPTLPTLGRT